MSWLYSRALVAEYSAASCLDGEQSAPSSSMNTPAMFLLQGKTTEASNLSRYGMTCAPLTENHGKDVLTLFQAAFPAKTLVAPERGPGLPENGQDSGEKWQGLLVKYSQDMFSSKTVLCSEQEDCQRFSKTLPKQGMMLAGECLELVMWERPINEKDCGYWPTPKHGDWRSGCQRRQFNTMLNVEVFRRNGIFPTGNRQERHQQLNPCWVEMLMGWPIGWTELNALETGKFQQWLDSHGIS